MSAKGWALTGMEFAEVGDGVVGVGGGTGALGGMDGFPDGFPAKSNKNGGTMSC